MARAARKQADDDDDDDDNHRYGYAVLIVVLKQKLVASQLDGKRNASTCTDNVCVSLSSSLEIYFGQTILGVHLCNITLIVGLRFGKSLDRRL